MPWAVLVVLTLMLAERRGWIYYRHRKPTSGSASAAAFGAASEVFSPGRQVVVVQEQSERVRRQGSDQGGATILSNLMTSH